MPRIIHTYYVKALHRSAPRNISYRMFHKIVQSFRLRFHFWFYCVIFMIDSLRWIHFWGWFIAYFLWMQLSFINLFIFGRERYLNENSMKAMDKNDSIEMIKFVGRQHSRLTSIMDQLNICYSFQVLLKLFIYVETNISFLMKNVW